MTVGIDEAGQDRRAAAVDDRFRRIFTHLTDFSNAMDEAVSNQYGIRSENGLFESSAHQRADVLQKHRGHVLSSLLEYSARHTAARTDSGFAGRRSIL
jgi:hypothetical protein